MTAAGEAAAVGPTRDVLVGPTAIAVLCAAACPLPFRRLSAPAAREGLPAACRYGVSSPAIEWPILPASSAPRSPWLKRNCALA